MKIIAALFFTFACCNVGACGRAESANPIQVEIVTAPDNTRCYVFVQDGQVKGGGCVR